MKWMLMPLQRYADFSGRSRRKEYWMFTLLNCIISAIWTAVVSFHIYRELIEVGKAGAVSIDKLDLLPSGMMTIFVVYALAAFIPSLAVMVRRFHDLGKPGWFVLFGLIPVGGFVLLIFMCLDGMRGKNQYGPDPKADSSRKEAFG
ncbi:DUF805 domain-containing protein [Parasphingorhabdus sp.]|uniref:DUF805 domain-containing protein n=1 Tax=Parasphingorhabdus sp. TaxID=2709688 RepID=UPI003267DEB6